MSAAQALLEQRGPAVTRRLAPRERTVEAVAAATFVAVAALMAVLAAPVGDAETAVLLTLCYALMRRVRFPLGPGLIRPTQLVFVPLLFLTPAALVPALVGIGAVLGELPELLRRRAHPERLPVIVADGWYAVGPALVVAAFDNRVAFGVLLLALAAQLATDVAASTLREWLGAGIAPGELLGVIALVAVIDATLAPIGYLAVLASQTYEHAYLLAIAPGILLGLIARERSERIARELALERAFRRSTRALDARAEELRRHAGRLSGDPDAPPSDRVAVERMLVATAVEALRADCGRLSELDASGALQPRLTIGGDGEAASGGTGGGVAAGSGAAAASDGVSAAARADLAAAERALGAQQRGALALAAGHTHVLAVARAAEPFSAVERDLLEHLAAQAAVSLENLHLEELMRRASAELRAILEGVADAVAAEDADGGLVYANAAAARLLDGAELGARLGIPADLLPGRRVFRGADAEPLVVRLPGTARWARVKARPVLEDGRPRLAISLIEDITEIKQAEEAQRLLAESSRALAGSLVVEDTLPGVVQLVAGRLADACAIHLLTDGELRLAAGEAELPPGLEEVAARGLPRVWPDALAVPILVRTGTAGTITLSGHVRPETLPVVEDLGLRVGAAVDNARLYRTRAAIAHTLQRSLLPPELPEIPGLELGARYRPAGEGIEAGGDFYDVFPTREREWFAVVGDVCGKGAEAAAVTALARYTIRAAVARHRSPAGILRWLNAAMLRQGAGRFVTLALARLDLEPDGSVIATVACGGHPHPRILRATGLVEALGETGTVLGVLDEIAPVDRATRLIAGDALILYTDGLTEVAPPRIWSPAQLDAAVAGARRRTAQGIVDHLAERADAEAEGPPRDDLALLALRVQPLL
ncbi:MAG TPA: SpoIIE family protein phosphatase [Solirubrobacter sp.]|nr:SpoIIE family protein phosphatase [Solirubrobacter sp.]